MDGIEFRLTNKKNRKYDTGLCKQLLNFNGNKWKKKQKIEKRQWNFLAHFLITFRLSAREKRKNTLKWNTNKHYSAANKSARLESRQQEFHTKNDKTTVMKIAIKLQQKLYTSKKRLGTREWLPGLRTGGWCFSGEFYI